MDRQIGGPELENPQGILPPTVYHLQAVSPRRAGAAWPFSGYPEGSPEQLLQPGPAAGEYLEEKGDQEEEEEEKKGLHPNIRAPEERGYPKTYYLILLFSPDKVPEPTSRRALPLPRPPAGPHRHLP